MRVVGKNSAGCEIDGSKVVGQSRKVQKLAAGAGGDQTTAAVLPGSTKRQIAAQGLNHARIAIGICDRSVTDNRAVVRDLAAGEVSGNTIELDTAVIRESLHDAGGPLRYGEDAARILKRSADGSRP